MLSALKNRDYRLLWIGQSISHLGDQFHLVALPWLVLTLTKDPLQLGLVMAAAGIPRAGLMLLGGAWADRFSPRGIMLVSDLGRFALTAALAVAIVSGQAQLWMVYVLAISFGVVSGFFLPAAEAALPRLVRSAELESGNSLMMGADQLATFVGPVVAGVLIATFGGASAGGQSVAALLGIGVAFGADALSFLVSAATLVLLRPLPGLGSRDTHPLAAVAEGVRFVVRDRMLLTLLTFITFANLCVTGPLLVGVPVVASTRLSEGAAAFGVIVSAYGLGNLLGMLACGALPRMSDRMFGVFSAVLFVAFGAVVALLGVLTNTWVIAALMVALGVGNGYIAVLVMTALQRLAPKAMLGRVMSLAMLSMYGLMPISMALTGALLKFSVQTAFFAAGAGLLVISVFAFAQRGMWSFPAEAPVAEAMPEPA